MLRVLLPPNLAAAAARDAIAVKVDIAAGAAPSAEQAPVLAWFQARVGAGARPPLFLQLTRAQLRDLIEIAENLPVFFWVNRPTEPLRWDFGSLVGASEHVGVKPAQQHGGDARFPELLAPPLQLRRRRSPRLPCASRGPPMRSPR